MDELTFPVGTELMAMLPRGEPRGKRMSINGLFAEILQRINRLRPQPPPLAA
jgi:hypothetical protein